MLAVDFANYTPVPTRQQIDCWKAQGYTRAIVGVSYGNVARAQLTACHEGGMEIEGFAWVTFGPNWEAPLERALNTIAGLPVTRLWLDCEDETNWMDWQIEARIRQCELYVRQRRPDLNAQAIYTGGWWWNKYCPNLTAFKDWDLWTANYTNHPESPPQGQPPLYGGWTEAAMWQYAGSIQTCGLNTDRNTILEDDMPLSDQDKRDIADIVRLENARQTNTLQDFLNQKFFALVVWLQGKLP